jgi:hypothetical protein
MQRCNVSLMLLGILLPRLLLIHASWDSARALTLKWLTQSESFEPLQHLLVSCLINICKLSQRVDLVQMR